MLDLIGAMIGGLVIGALSRLFYPGDVPMGWGMTMLLGVGGSLLASLAANRGRADGFNRTGCLASVLGGMVLIFIGRTLGWQ